MMGWTGEISVAVARFLPSPIKRFVHRHHSFDNTVRRLYGKLVSSSEPSTIPSGPMAGLRLLPCEHTSHAHIRGAYERETQDALDRFVQKEMVCYDLGASIGYFSLLLARRVKQVYAFEASPIALETMRANLHVNQFHNVSIVPQPVSDTRQVVRFAITDNAFGSGIVHGNPPGWPTIEIETVVLDEFAATHPGPDLIKIDIEGAEAAALAGAKNILAQKRPIIVCELHGRPVAEEVRDLLLRNDYELTDLSGQPFQIPSMVVPGEVHVVGKPAERGTLPTA